MDKRGFFSRIKKIEKNLVLNKYDLTKFQTADDSRLKISNFAGSLDDYKDMKESVQNINLSISQQELAYQPIKIRSSYFK